MTKVLITRAFIEIDPAEFCEEFDVTLGVPDDYMDRAELFQHIRDASAVVARHDDHINREVIDAAPELKIISNYGAGYETVDVEAATERGIWVTNTPDVLTEATADTTLMLLLAACRRMYEAESYVRSGEWKVYDPNLFHSTHPNGKLLGIIGMGRIGQALARRARALGMNIIYHNRRRVADEIEQELGAKYLSLDELLRAADIISLHTPLTPETNYMIDEPQFARMKDGVIIINTARGQVVRETALVEALKSGKVHSAGLDVYENEPDVHPELLPMKNVTLLPHIGSATRETRAEMANLALENIRLVLNGKRPKTPVNEV